MQSLKNCPGCDNRKRNVDKAGLCLLKRASDGLLARCSGEWSQDKLFYLQRYLDIVTTSMRKRWALCYVDLFAGPGKCIVRPEGIDIDGSPLCALQLRHTFDRYFFVDISKENTECLQKRIQNLSISPHGTFLVQDCNKAIPVISEQLGPNFLTVAFMDPTGFQLDFASIETLVRNRRVDLIINFPYRALQRVIPRALSARSSELDRFFGGRNWRTVCQEAKQQGNDPAYALMKHYKEKLLELGYIEDASPSGDISVQSSIGYLYSLICMSKHALGKKFWGKIQITNRHGQQKLFPVN